MPSGSVLPRRSCSSRAHDEAAQDLEADASLVEPMGSDYLFVFHGAQRQRFRDGDLARDWHHRYPELFDEADERVLRTVHQRRYNFLEWLAAVLLFEATGYRSLVAKYTAKSHPNKRLVLGRCLPPPLLEWVLRYEPGQPDLFCYSHDFGSWFFCEVKGPGDRIRDNQREWRACFEEQLLTQKIGTTGRYRTLRLDEI